MCHPDRIDDEEYVMVNNSKQPTDLLKNKSKSIIAAGLTKVNILGGPLF